MSGNETIENKQSIILPYCVTTQIKPLTPLPSDNSIAAEFANQGIQVAMLTPQHVLEHVKSLNKKSSPALPKASQQHNAASGADQLSLFNLFNEGKIVKFPQLTHSPLVQQEIDRFHKKLALHLVQQPDVHPISYSVLASLFESGEEKLLKFTVKYHSFEILALKFYAAMLSALLYAKIDFPINGFDIKVPENFLKLTLSDVETRLQKGKQDLLLTYAEEANSQSFDPNTLSSSPADWKFHHKEHILLDEDENTYPLNAHNRRVLFNIYTDYAEHFHLTFAEAFQEAKKRNRLAEFAQTAIKEIHYCHNLIKQREQYCKEQQSKLIQCKERRHVQYEHLLLNYIHTFQLPAGGKSSGKESDAEAEIDRELFTDLESSGSTSSEDDDVVSFVKLNRPGSNLFFPHKSGSLRNKINTLAEHLSDSEEEEEDEIFEEIELSASDEIADESTLSAPRMPGIYNAILSPATLSELIHSLSEVADTYPELNIHFWENVLSCLNRISLNALKKEDQKYFRLSLARALPSSCYLPLPAVIKKGKEQVEWFDKKNSTPLQPGKIYLEITDNGLIYRALRYGTTDNPFAGYISTEDLARAFSDFQRIAWVNSFPIDDELSVGTVYVKKDNINKQLDAKIKKSDGSIQDYTAPAKNLGSLAPNIFDNLVVNTQTEQKLLAIFETTSNSSAKENSNSIAKFVTLITNKLLDSTKKLRSIEKLAVAYKEKSISLLNDEEWDKLFTFLYSGSNEQNFVENLDDIKALLSGDDRADEASLIQSMYTIHKAIATPAGKLYLAKKWLISLHTHAYEMHLQINTDYENKTLLATLCEKEDLDYALLITLLLLGADPTSIPAHKLDNAKGIFSFVQYLHLFYQAKIQCSYLDPSRPFNLEHLIKQWEKLANDLPLQTPDIVELDETLKKELNERSFAKKCQVLAENLRDLIAQHKKTTTPVKNLQQEKEFLEEMQRIALSLEVASWQALHIHHHDQPLLDLKKQLRDVYKNYQSKMTETCKAWFFDLGKEFQKAIIIEKSLNNAASKDLVISPYCILPKTPNYQKCIVKITESQDGIITQTQAIKDRQKLIMGVYIHQQKNLQTLTEHSENQNMKIHILEAKQKESDLRQLKTNKKVKQLEKELVDSNSRILDFFQKFANQNNLSFPPSLSNSTNSDSNKKPNAHWSSNGIGFSYSGQSPSSSAEQPANNALSMRNIPSFTHQSACSS